MHLAAGDCQCPTRFNDVTLGQQALARRWRKLFEETLAKLEMSVALNEALLRELDEPAVGLFDQEMSMN